MAHRFCIQGGVHASTSYQSVITAQYVDYFVPVHILEVLAIVGCTYNLAQRQPRWKRCMVVIY